MQMRAYVRLSEAWWAHVGSCLLDALWYGRILVNVRLCVWKDYSQWSYCVYNTILIKKPFIRSELCKTKSVWMIHEYLYFMRLYFMISQCFLDYSAMPLNEKAHDWRPIILERGHNCNQGNMSVFVTSVWMTIVYICKTDVLDLSGDGGISWCLPQIWKLFIKSGVD